VKLTYETLEDELQQLRQKQTKIYFNQDLGVKVLLPLRKASFL